MNNCIFCKIVEREIPAHIFYEDDKFIAFLDIRPRSPGNALVIPKKHYRWVWDVPNVGECFEVVKKIALAEQRAFDELGIHCKIVGEEIEHAHVRLYPDPKLTKGDKMDFEGNKKRLLDALK